MSGVRFKIRLRSVVSRKPVYGRFDEYQVVSSRKIVGRFDMLPQAQRAYPSAEVDRSAMPRPQKVANQMEKRFTITIEKIIRTKFEVTAKSRSEARRKIEDYGPDLAATDYANSDDEIITRIKSVRESS